MSNMEKSYPMGSSNDPKCRRGRCVILNYEKYPIVKLADGKVIDRTRKGTDKDVAALTKTFTALNFEILIHNNLTQKGTDMVLDIESKIANHSNYHCFVLCILAHGKENEFKCIDEELFKYDKIYAKIDACKELTNKPKLFFIQACQGSRLNKGRDVLAPDEYTVTYGPPSKSANLTPQMSDIFKAICSYHGYLSMRSEHDGSWFIQTLCTVLNKYAKKHDLETMLTEVRHRMSQKIAERTIECDDKTVEDQVDYVKQTSKIESTLRCKVKFF